MDRGAWWATIYGGCRVHKESDTTEQLTLCSRKQVNKLMDFLNKKLSERLAKANITKVNWLLYEYQSMTVLKFRNSISKMCMHTCYLYFRSYKNIIKLTSLQQTSSTGPVCICWAFGIVCPLSWTSQHRTYSNKTMQTQQLMITPMLPAIIR